MPTHTNHALKRKLHGPRSQGIKLLIGRSKRARGSKLGIVEVHPR